MAKIVTIKTAVLIAGIIEPRDFIAIGIIFELLATEFKQWSQQLTFAQLATLRDPAQTCAARSAQGIQQKGFSLIIGMMSGNNTVLAFTNRFKQVVALTTRLGFDIAIDTAEVKSIDADLKLIFFNLLNTELLHLCGSVLQTVIDVPGYQCKTMWIVH